MKTELPMEHRSVDIARGLVALGIPVFKARITSEGVKEPWGHKNGHLEASLDPGLVEDWFTENKSARVGAYLGAAGLIGLDVDEKNGKSGWDSLEKSWYEIPSTFSYETPSGGTHLIYTAPEGKNLAPATNYRGMQGVDIRAGSSWVLWNGDVPKSREEFSPAPEWMLDEKTVKSSESFSGGLKEWYDTLEVGPPNVAVRRAIERVNNDMSHQEMVSATYEAIRLGAEAATGVPELLSALEDAWLSRDPGGHTTPEDRWEWKFHEALSSGIERYGDSIELRKSLPAYDINKVPASVPDNLLTGAPGGKAEFSALLRELQRATDDDLFVTSVLWNSPRTRDISREWSLEFVHERVLSARSKPEPIRENPSLPDRSTKVQIPDTVEHGTHAFLTDEEVTVVKRTRTFIDEYLEASLKKGFSVPAYDVPAAWTALSMAFGTKVVLAYNGLGINLWFIEMGGTGTGKTSSMKFLRSLLDIVAYDEQGYYNVGASSSPTAIHEELLMRDGLASMIHHDEAASFFSDLHDSQWMKTLEHHFSRFYDGDVEPSNKVRLPKEIRGKRATTSFGLNMSATPDKLLSLVTTGMFESGFMSRVNWTWAPDRDEGDEERFNLGPTEVDARTRTHPAVFDLASDLLYTAYMFPGETVVGATDEGWARLSKAALAYDAMCRSHERYDVLQGPLTRLTETLVKCAALTALYDGRTQFTETDALIAIWYGTDWFYNFLRVVEETSESEFSRSANEIEAYIRTQGGSVTATKLLHRFRAMIQRSPRELDDRISFLVNSGRINPDRKDGTTTYSLNGSGS